MFCLPLKRMFRRPIIGVFVALLAWLIPAAPASAQIASQVSDDGKVVFVNAEPAKTARHWAPNGFQPVPPAGTTRTNETVMSVVPPDRLDHIVQDAAARHKMDPALIKAVIGVESNWNPTAVSRKGALGLMQLIPSTAGQLGVGNAFDPAQNVEGGTSYLRSLLDRFHGDLEKSLAAYNAGPGLVERVGGVPNIPETRSYVQRVTNSYFRPESGRNPSLYAAPKHPMRRDVDDHGRVVFTNE
jgi:soluble lytic murein transglycosylase-like protein